MLNSCISVQVHLHVVFTCSTCMLECMAGPQLKNVRKTFVSNLRLASVFRRADTTRVKRAT